MSKWFDPESLSKGLGSLASKVQSIAAENLQFVDDVPYDDLKAINLKLREELSTIRNNPTSMGSEEHIQELQQAINAAAAREADLANSLSRVKSLASDKIKRLLAQIEEVEAEKKRLVLSSSEQQSVVDDSDLMLEIEQLREERDQLRNELKGSQNTVTKSQKEALEVQREMDDYADKVNTEQLELSRQYSIEVKELKEITDKQSQEYRESLESSEIIISNLQSDHDELLEAFGVLKKETVGLRNKVEASKSAEKDAKLKEIERIETLKDAVESEKDRTIDLSQFMELQDQLKTLEKESEEMRATIEENRVWKLSTMDLNKEEETIHALEIQKQNLEDRERSMKQEILQLSLKSESLEHEIIDLKSRDQNVELEKVAANGVLTALNRHVVELESQIESMRKSQKDGLKVKVDVAPFVNPLTNQLEDVQSKLETLTMEYDNALYEIKQLQNLELNTDQAGEELNLELKRLNDQKEEDKLRLLELNKTIKGLNSELLRSQEEILLLSSQIELLNIELEKERSSSIESQALLESLSTENNILDQEKVSLEDNLAQFKQVVGEKIESEMAENSRLRGLLEENRIEMEDMASPASNIDLEAEAEYLRVKTVELALQIQKSEAETERLRQYLMEVEEASTSDTLATQSTIEEYKMQIIGLERERDNLIEMSTDDQEQRNREKNEVLGYQNKINAIGEEKNRLQLEIGKSATVIKNLQNVLTQFEAGI